MLADEAEEDATSSNLRPTFRAKSRMRVGPSIQRTECAIAKSDGTLFASLNETLNRWRKHYETMPNHASEDASSELDTQPFTAAPIPAICEDDQTLYEVQEAIRKLKNGRASGPDGITPVTEVR